MMGESDLGFFVIRSLGVSTSSCYAFTAVCVRSPSLRRSRFVC